MRWRPRASGAMAFSYLSVPHWGQVSSFALAAWLPHFLVSGHRFHICASRAGGGPTRLNCSVGDDSATELWSNERTNVGRVAEYTIAQRSNNVVCAIAQWPRNDAKQPPGREPQSAEFLQNLNHCAGA